MVGLIFIVLFSYVVIFTCWKPNVISEAELNKCSIDLTTVFTSFISICPFNDSSSRKEFILDISSRSIFSVKSSLYFRPKVLLDAYSVELSCLAVFRY